MELAKHWWEQPLRITQLNLTVPDAGRDGARMAARVHEYGANALLINAGGIYAFYPTDVPFHRRAPGLSGDLLGDAIGYCRESGLHVVVRYDLIGLQRDAYEARPEWFYRSHDGRAMVDKGLYMTCPNAGWWQEQFFRLWDELTARYQVNGLFFNAWGHKEATREGVYFGPCHCAACVRLFRERYGRDVRLRLAWDGAPPEARATRADERLDPGARAGGYELTLARLELFEQIVVG